MKWIAAATMAFILTQPTTPQHVVDDLLAADRAFAAAAANTTVIPALSAMFADDVVLPTPVPAPGFARGKTAAIEALKSNPANQSARLEWAPVRAGVSADGQHGFTAGYMTLTTDGKVQPLKYLAYWVKKQDGWRVTTYRRVPVNSPPTSRAMLPPVLPARLVAATSEPGVIANHKATLEAAEKAFSDEAQKIGLGPAFTKHGSEDAINLGPPTVANVIVSATEIGKNVGQGSEGKPSPVSWAADEGSLVASSGDLGVTFGFIRQNAEPPPGRPAAVPFFTIWRRAEATGVWRYIAE